MPGNPAIFDPTSGAINPATGVPVGGWDPLNGGQSNVTTMLFQILMELRVLNQQMQFMNQGFVGEPDDLDNMRADQILEPNFYQVKGS